MNLTKEEIIKEICNGSEVGKQILKVEIEYYKGLAEPSQKTKSHQHAKNQKEDCPIGQLGKN